MNVNENSQIWKKINTLLDANSQMTTAIKSIQNQFKKKKKKEKTEKILVFNSLFLFIASVQILLSQFQSLNIHMITDIVDTVDLTDYDFCTSFLTDNDSDFHIINHFYQDYLMNIYFVNDVKICHDSDITFVELIDDVYYNMYD